MTGETTMADRTSLYLTAAVAGALALFTANQGQAEEAAGLEKCYGIAKAGENSCANSAGTHSCAGQAATDYDGGEWRAVGMGHCVELGGQLEPFEGVNPNKA
jgi:uncharacterized membrane protein